MSLQLDFEILGFWEKYIFFKLKNKIIILNKRLPKEDMILKLKVQPEDVKDLRDEILFQASKIELTYDAKDNLLKGM